MRVVSGGGGGRGRRSLFSFAGGRKQRRGPLTCAKSITAAEKPLEVESDFLPACSFWIFSRWARRKTGRSPQSPTAGPRFTLLPPTPEIDTVLCFFSPAAAWILSEDVVSSGLQNSSSGRVQSSARLWPDWWLCGIYWPPSFDVSCVAVRRFANAIFLKTRKKFS